MPGVTRKEVEEMFAETKRKPSARPKGCAAMAVLEDQKRLPPNLRSVGIFVSCSCLGCRKAVM